jgi:cell wall-associated NlpC family hydrolase
MKNIRAAYLLTGLVLTSCANVPQQMTVPETSVHSLETMQEIRMRLIALYSSWSGVRYQEGGLSKQGIDCSGLVYLTYRQYFNIQLPRTTDQLAENGISVSLDRLIPGDLVFFKTGLFQKHVGIYYGDRQFMHASTSQGVTLSSLSAAYWEENVWQARRILSEHNINL